jgi:hypothetical protein
MPETSKLSRPTAMALSLERYCSSRCAKSITYLGVRFGWHSFSGSLSRIPEIRVLAVGLVF